jgi:saccharopine dehydrogenase-like NADP-dependent oxidoreductase
MIIKVPPGYEDVVIPFKFDIHNSEVVNEEVSHASIVVSLLPASLHPLLIDHCLEHSKHLITASYTSEAMKLVHDEAQKKGILFLNEIGLDPGIDHMSCMQVL